MKRVLFCWEIGESSGHVVPYLSLIAALRQRGWEVAVVARNTAEVGARVRACGATLFQAPVCLSIFPGMDADSFNSTELLLQHGYGHEPIFDGMFSSWLSLLQTWQPDLVIGSNAPTAHLAAQCLGVPDVAIGTGQTCPIAANPAPLTRPWQPGIEQRIAANEDRVRQTVNAVLQKHKFARRQFPMDMYSAVPTLLGTLPELDHFGAQRGAEPSYLGRFPSVVSERDSQQSAPTGNFDIFVYLRYTKAIDGLLNALAKRSTQSLVYMPNLTPGVRVKLETQHGSSLIFASHALDLNKVLPSVKLVISNAGHGLTLQCLLAGKPLMLLPTHWEQSVVADHAVKTGAASVVSPSERHPKFHRRIDDMLQNATYREAAESFAARYEKLSATDALERALVACERRADASHQRTKLVSVG
jgi:UDP:flavonoid glycosyltransferase YjiC (YdhE family)